MEIDALHLHHAYLLTGSWNREAVIALVLEMSGARAENNPDLVIHEGSFGIDHARTLGERISVRPFGGTRIIIVDARSMTVQAQNALLKTLEEPGEGNHFFLVAPYEDILLPTLRSRLQKFSGEALIAPVPAASRGKGSPENFLGLAIAKRLDFAKKFKDNEEDLSAFLDALLAHLKAAGKTPEIQKAFAMRRYADDAASDSRLILEHLALVL